MLLPQKGRAKMCIRDRRKICDGVNFRSIRDSRFKTVRISVNFFVPLQNDTVAANALLPFLLSRASEDYPDYTKLGQKLAELYGADLTLSLIHIYYSNVSAL